MPDIGIVAFWVMITNLVMLVLPIILLAEPGMWPWLAPGCLLKTLADFILLYRVTGVTGERASLAFFFPVFLMYYPLQPVVLAGILFKRNTWKGRKQP